MKHSERSKVRLAPLGAPWPSISPCLLSLSLSLCVCLSVSLCVCMSVCFSFSDSVSAYVCLCVCVSVSLCVCVCVCVCDKKKKKSKTHQKWRFTNSHRVIHCGVAQGGVGCAQQRQHSVPGLQPPNCEPNKTLFASSQMFGENWLMYLYLDFLTRHSLEKVRYVIVDRDFSHCNWLLLNVTWDPVATSYGISVFMVISPWFVILH